MTGFTVRVSRLVWGSHEPEITGEVGIEDLIVLLRQDATARRLEDDRLRVYVLEVLDHAGCVERRVVYGGYPEVEGFANSLIDGYASAPGGIG
jgi:hypothetical protein